MTTLNVPPPEAALKVVPWWPHKPHPKQALALWAYQNTPDVCYGGAAGGGKTDYLLMAASQFCDQPDYNALIIRKTYQDLSLPGAIMNRAIEWWHGRWGILWKPAEHKLVWPSGAVIQFGHMDSQTAHLRYQGAELQFVGIDEATQIPAPQLMYLHSRLRRLEDSEVPLRYRLATNPGGVSHEWVRDNYVHGADGREVVYLPALLHDNPSLDADTYRSELSKLDPITRRQLEAGDWDAMLSGGFFEVDRIDVCDGRCEEDGQTVRAWDLAATPETPGTDPDWTVGLKMTQVGEEFHVHDMIRLRAGPAGVEKAIQAAAERDGPGVTQAVEQEPGSSGLMVRRHLATNALRGYTFRSVRSTGRKYERAKPIASAVSNGLLQWVDQPGRLQAMTELRAFSEDEKTYAHDDIVDALSLAHYYLTRRRVGNSMLVGIS